MGWDAVFNGEFGEGVVEGPLEALLSEKIIILRILLLSQEALNGGSNVAF